MPLDPQQRGTGLAGNGRRELPLLILAVYKTNLDQFVVFESPVDILYNGLTQAMLANEYNRLQIMGTGAKVFFLSCS
jgi:hypothetical protein